MEIFALFIGLMLSHILCKLNIALAMNISGNHLKPRFADVRSDAGVSTEASSVKCSLQGTTHLPAFSMDGDYVIGGFFSIHH